MGSGPYKTEFNGEYKDGKKWKGQIKEYYKDILVFDGKLLNGEKHGPAKEYYNNGKLEFESVYLNGKKMEK